MRETVMKTAMLFTGSGPIVIPSANPWGSNDLLEEIIIHV
jgi:hypothetical protein